MSSSLPNRAKGHRNAPRALQETFTVDASSLQKPQEVEGDSGMEESDDEPLINDKDIEESMAKMHRLTISLVGIISKAVVLDRFSWPQLADMHIWYSECYHLFRLGLGFKDENLDSVFRRLQVNFDDIPVYLRMLVAVDVYNRVLVTEYPDLPWFSQQWVNATFEPMIKKWDAQSRSDVKKIAMKALSRQERVNEKLAKLPEQLTRELFEALNPLLLCHKSPAVDREASRSRRQKLEEQYGKRLAEIYKHAVALRKALSLKNFSYSFFWIDAGEDFNNAIMDAEIHAGRVEFYSPVVKEQHKVIATMLPGICRSEGQIERPIFSIEPSKEKNIIVRALVYLGETRKG